MGEGAISPVHGTEAQTTLYEAPSRALVFATGTLGWEYALSPVPQASPDAPSAPDPRVVAMTRNLLAPGARKGWLGPRGERVQAGVAGQVDVLAVADHRIERPVSIRNVTRPVEMPRP